MSDVGRKCCGLCQGGSSYDYKCSGWLNLIDNFWVFGAKILKVSILIIKHTFNRSKYLDVQTWNGYLEDCYKIEDYWS